ncbi:MAG: twin-arginine translocase TatA/TatE family subunit [Deltaproteobacteria bacterium]|nr:twin-arginine translocase TatA/TatE family subunit [Deltaproteobacteria bacterium]
MLIPNGEQLLVILVIVLIVFGGKKIPELMGGLGKGIKSFKKGLNATDDELEPKPEHAEKLEQKQDKPQ